MSNCSCNSMDSSTDPLSRKLLVQVQPGAQSQATSHSASPDRETGEGRADVLYERLQLNSPAFTYLWSMNMQDIGNAKSNIMSESGGS